MTPPDDGGKWSILRDVDGATYDPRPTLLRLKNGEDSAWNELWSHLHREVMRAGRAQRGWRLSR